ncbi:GlcG/HbpS family heme-binding protein [Nisaea sp.]|uniref:GlcG/HbpS family heme-binding protein n=1 Tax=Nisaea sp. TaxID=2024842 RepID=UPI002B26CC2F|nr:heme-binding protein [Nisaea sp.]
MSEYFLINVASSLTLDQARAVCDGTIAAGRKADLLPLTVAVLDSGANLVHFQREDGCGTVRGDIAIGKAGAALGMGIPSRTIRDRLKDRPAFQSAIAAASDGKFIPVPGGVLILNSAGQAIGAVGVSGDASDRDEAAAIVGIKVAGLISNPSEPAENWQNAAL